MGPSSICNHTESVANITVAPISGSGDEIWFEESDDLQTIENGNTSNEEEEINKDDNNDTCQSAMKLAFMPLILPNIDVPNERTVGQLDQIELEEDEQTIKDCDVKTVCGYFCFYEINNHINPFNIFLKTGNILLWVHHVSFLFFDKLKPLN